MSIKFVCNFSGGITSWAAAKRIAEKNGTDEMVLLFADTKIEDEDCYRFLEESAENIGAPLIKISDGRDPWQVFEDNRFIGNSRVDLCSRILKRDLLNKWHKENAPEATSVVGLTFDEPERIEKFQAKMKEKHGISVIAPLAEKPWISKQMAIEWAKSEGIEPPRLYAMGFAHANCGGFCVKAGHGQFALLNAWFPERYREHEAKEKKIRESLSKDVSILRDRKGGKTRPVSMEEFRKRLDLDGISEEEKLDHGGCGCAVTFEDGE